MLINIDYLNSITSFKEKNIYFIGILGSGMQPLAKFMAMSGANVSGSDRNFHIGSETEKIKELIKLNCSIYTQNGFHIDNNTDFAVISTAIEKSNPDIQSAIEKKVPIVHRTDLLSHLFNNKRGIAIAGTSGKSTTTGITGYILKKSGLDLNIINGAYIKNILSNNKNSNCIYGTENIFLIETDESDGSIVKYKPDTGIITGISKDHKTIEELLILFQGFIDNCKNNIIVNRDNHYVRELDFSNANLITFGIDQKNVDYKISDIKINNHNSSFSINNETYHVNLPGLFNIYNSTAAIITSKLMHISTDVIKDNLNSFKGVGGRFELIGSYKNKCDFIFDFAHNPEKIESLLKYLNSIYDSILFIYQPHGFTPTYFNRKEFVKVFKNNITKKSVLILLPIYYAGGTVDKKISSQILTKTLNDEKIIVYHFSRDKSKEFIKENINNYSAIILTGARDDTLKPYLNDILSDINSF